MDSTLVMPGATDTFNLQACRSLMRGGSKTFFAASLLLPARIRLSATALYAFCRVADDLIDDGADKVSAMRELHQRLDAVYRAQPRNLDADLALSLVVHQHAIPRALLDALLEGFDWDAAHRRYETLEELHGYAARVASTVGAMMTLIMGVREPAALSRACDLGAAMQLTNIARDVGEDARAGRLYLPLQWLREEGIDPDAWLGTPTFEPGIARVVERLLSEADRLYRRAEHGIALLPRDCQGAIRAAGWVYAEIGREIERRGLNSVDTRAVVSSRRKLLLLGKALAWPTRPRGVSIQAAHDDAAMMSEIASANPLPATRFLVEAACGWGRQSGPGGLQGLPLRPASTDDLTTPEGAVVWLIDLFERREHRRRATGRPGPSEIPWTARTGP